MEKAFYLVALVVIVLLLLSLVLGIPITELFSER